jgi:hypothetical protein
MTKDATTTRSRTREMAARARDSSPDEIDRRIAVLARALEVRNVELAFHLLEVERRGIYAGFGDRSAAHYAEGRHQLSNGKTYRLIRAAKAFEKSDLLREAFERGDVRISKVDVLSPKLGRGEDAAWVEQASHLTREREGRRRGFSPRGRDRGRAGHDHDQARSVAAPARQRGDREVSEGRRRRHLARRRARDAGGRVSLDAGG